NGSAGEWNKHPLVRIESYRVSKIDSFKFVTMLFRKGDWTTICGIDVIPTVLFTGDRGQLPKWIDNARRGGSGNTNHTERQFALGAICFDSFPHFVGKNMKSIVRRNLANAVAPETKYVGTLLDGVMTLLGGINYELR